MPRALLLLFASLAHAQWTAPAAKQPNLTARAPKHDLSGIWTVPPVTLGDGGPPRYVTYLAADLPPNTVPLKPAALALIQQRLAKSGAEIPYSRCLPAGLPMAGLFPAPMKIIQSRGLSLFLYESTNGFRQIFTDGRTLPKDPVPAWQGYSIGHWERDTFVVESNGFNDRTWLDGIGHPHGEKLHITERYSRRDFGHMDLELTIDDPDWYERPWSVKVLFNLTPADELIENVCLENERDAEHMK